MKYFFVLGNNPTLSVAELTTVLGVDKKFELNENILVADLEKEINARDLISRLGGTIKVGIINSEIKNIDTEILLNKIKTLLAPKDKKYNFGISYYGKRRLNFKPLAMEIKKYLKEQSISCRWVVSREATLSSVVVEQNKLTNQGQEFIIIESNKPMLGTTLSVQPFKNLSARDYGRPARDDQSGMLPPKLAQIMINLSGAKPDDTILDPFCGSGTILTEAMLMGYKNLIGSDLSGKAIADTKTNVDWTIINYELEIRNWKLLKIDAQNLSSRISPKSIDRIICGPFLGPQRGKLEINKVKRDLEALYSRSLHEFKKVLKSNGRIIMLFPVYYNKHFINPDLNGWEIVPPIPNNLVGNKNIRLTQRKTIIYGREGQKVYREIVILENK